MELFLFIVAVCEFVHIVRDPLYALIQSLGS